MCCNQKFQIVVIVIFDIIYMALTGMMLFMNCCNRFGGDYPQIIQVAIVFTILSAVISCCIKDAQYMWLPFMICKIGIAILAFACTIYSMTKIRWITTMAYLFHTYSNDSIFRLKCSAILTLHVISLRMHNYR